MNKGFELITPLRDSIGREEISAKVTAKYGSDLRITFGEDKLPAIIVEIFEGTIRVITYPTDDSNVEPFVHTVRKLSKEEKL